MVYKIIKPKIIIHFTFIQILIYLRTRDMLQIDKYEH